ncbi:MAG: WbqC family protein [Tannerella sp.]|jgi:hypothetical protein|nr:WbqC family protein [Tannerella sp.]
MSTVYLSTAYLAPVQYYCKLCAFDSVVVEAYENYPKQTYRNRCLIASANGIQLLSVPVEKPSGKCPTKDIRISEHGHWRHQHWQALVSAYGASPFFEYYRDDLAPFYRRKYVFLLDFNEALRETVCALLDIRPAVRHSTHYEASVPHDFREIIRPGRPVRDDTFHPCPYHQVFAARHGFLPNMSIVDLLFNMGPEGEGVLLDSGFKARDSAER